MHTVTHRWGREPYKTTDRLVGLGIRVLLGGAGDRTSNRQVYLPLPINAAHGVAGEMG